MKDKKRLPIVAVEKAFNEAIDRIIARKPRHPKLRHLAKQDRLTISPSSVALDAGHSRTLIGMEGCRLPKVRDRILKLSRPDDVAPPRSASAAIAQLRVETLTLRSQVAAALEAQQAHFLAREKAERDAAKWRDAFRRLNETPPSGGNVVPITPQGAT